MRLTRSAASVTATLLFSFAAMSGTAMAQPLPPTEAAKPPSPPQSPATPPLPSPPTTTAAGAPPAGPATTAAPAPGEPPKGEPSPPADAPPPPPPAGAKVAAPEPPPPPPKAFPVEPEVSAKHDGPPLAGWNGGFFLRDSHDYFRLYPRGRLQLDFNSYFGPGVSKIAAVDGGNALKSKLFVKRARFEVAGEFLKSFTFHLSIEGGSQPISNSNGKAQTAAGKFGEDPSANSARWAATQTPSASASLADNWINYSICPCLNFILGQYDAPFSMENRTSDTISDWMELNLPIRSFVVPIKKEIGLGVWGEFGEKNLNYELGVFAGDGQNRPQVDNSVDFIGRVYSRPFAKKGSKDLLAKAQIGISMRHGERDQEYVSYGYPGITSSQGFTLWNPSYKNAEGRTTQIIPSGAQNAIGGELRLPLSVVDLRAEAYYVANNTREAIDGTQVANTERLGRIKGVGWYASISAWPLGDAYISGDPGIVRPTNVDISKDPGKPKRGLQVIAIVAAVNANYAGDTRCPGDDPNAVPPCGVPDAKTPGSPGVTTKITTFEYGFGANYWYTKHVRASINYIVYHTPGSGGGGNLASVPGNAVAETKESAHVLHELSTRIALAF